MSELMTLDEIAALWHCSRRYARDILTKLPGFPPKARGSTFKNPVWLRKKVMAFLEEESEAA